jgi:hypothetical protein
MINSLTPEQTAQMKVYAEKWTKIGLSTERIDREKAKVYAQKLYKFLENPHEPEVIFAEGPTEAWEIIQKITGEKLDFIWPYLDGQFWSFYSGWLNYYRDVLKVEITIDTSILEELVNYGLIYPLEKHCIITERMSVCKRNGHGLHCDGGPALEYKDGTKVWSLNGVRVPQWLAETPAEQLNAKEFAKISNVEVRREFIRKIGIEKLCNDLGSTVLDKKGNYELHEVDLGTDVGKWPYLKMLNPSIGVWHMECVDQSCRTVTDAICWRNQSNLEPEVLT